MTPDLSLRDVLAATDLGAGSDAVLRAAAALCALGGARLHVLHALDLSPSPQIDVYAGSGGFRGRIEAAERALRDQVERAVPPHVEVASIRVEIYAAHRAIDERAQEVGAAVVVIGPHTKREQQIAFLGGTADRLVRTLGVPCLVARGTMRMPLRRVVMPVDLSDWSWGALGTALAWSSAFGAHRGEDGTPTELAVVHVAPEAVADSVPTPTPPHGSAPEGVRISGTVLRGESPADAVVAFAEGAERAELIVMATHGYGAIRRALVGAIAQKVARSAPCPVLLIPPAFDGERA